MVLIAAQEFFKASFTYVLLKMGINEEFQSHAVWINIFKRKEARWVDVTFFVTKYQHLLKFDEFSYNKLYDDFKDFQTIIDSEIGITGAVIRKID